MTDSAKGFSGGATGRPPWATGPTLGSTGARTFKPPSAPPSPPPFSRPFTAPARSSPSELRPPKSPRPTKREAKSPTKSPWRPPGKPGTYTTAILSALVILLVAVACLLTWKAFSHSGTPGAASVEAPLPAKEFKKSVGVKPKGPTGTYPVAVKNDDGNKTMTTEDMGPSTLFIPALGVYMPVEADTAFVESAYVGFDTIKVPKNAWHGVWYAGGAPMSGGQQGVTMIAAHVSTTNGWGALRRLHTLTGGEMIYTKDAKGVLQSWQMTQMRVEKHTDFPQEYWSSEGNRRLVVTTCGGTVNAQNYFMQNIFAVAEPVDTPPQPVTA